MNLDELYQNAIFPTEGEPKQQAISPVFRSSFRPETETSTPQQAEVPTLRETARVFGQGIRTAGSAVRKTLFPTRRERLTQIQESRGQFFTPADTKEAERLVREEEKKHLQIDAPIFSKAGFFDRAPIDPTGAVSFIKDTTPQALTKQFLKNVSMQLKQEGKEAIARTFQQKLKTEGIKSFDDLMRAVNKTGVVDDTINKWITTTKPVFEEYGFAVQKAGNLRLDKFAISKEGRDELARIVKENGDFIAQRRGVQSFTDTEKAASEIVSNIKLKAGKSLNAEKLQALGNTIASLQTRVSEFANTAKTAGGSLENAARLQLAQQELIHALSSYSGATAEAGRSLSILRNLRKAMEGGDIDAIRKAVKLSEGRIPTGELAKRIADFGDDQLGRLNFLRNLGKVKTTDKLNELWINSILSNPLTQAVNITGNTVQTLLSVPTRATQASIELLKGRKREVFMREIPHQLVGMAEGFTTGVQKALYVLKNGITIEQASKLDVVHLPAIKGRTGEIVRIPTKLLTAADEFFKAINGTAELRSVAYRMARKEGLTGTAAIQRMHELIANPSKELLSAVDFRKLSSTFQQPLGNFGRAVINFRESAPGLRYIVPFIKTPTNIAKEAVKISPLGFVNVGRKVFQKKYASLPANQMTEELAKATIGSIITIPIVLATLQGKITGAAPEKDAERDAFYRQGKQAYAIKIGDKWVQYRRVEPFATIFGAIADFTKLSQEEDLSKAAQSIVAIIARNLNDKTFLQGISNTIDAITDPARYGERFVQNISSGFQPFSGTSRFITRIADPVIRSPESVIDTFQSQIPGLSERVPPRLTAFGTPLERTLSQSVSPFGVTQETQDPVELELASLGYSVSFPGKTQLGQKLTDEEYRKLLLTAGQVTHDILAELIASPDWQNLSPLQKERALDRIVDEVRVRVKERLFPEKVVEAELRKRLKETRKLSDKEADTLTKKIMASEALAASPATP